MNVHAICLLLLPLSICRPANAQESGPGVQHSSSCSRCHSNSPRAIAMRDAEGREIAPHDLWKSTMMANSARDPLWRAVLSAEIAATPAARGEIESTCMRCHAPMADRVGLEDHDSGTLLHLLDCDSELGEMARDGVSCTICHGIAAEGLGSEESFSAGFRLDAQRRLFGPHENPFPMPMQPMTGFTPTLGEHVTSSALCGSCHTLETDALHPDGSSSGMRFLEQSPYLEWRNSAFQNEREPTGRQAASCQDCHAPTEDQDGQPIRTTIARNPGGRDFPRTVRREPFGRHLFVGGNTLVLSLFRDHAEELGLAAPPAAFDATLDATREQLRHRSARLRIDNVQRKGEQLSFRVDVENLTGHKLPTGHPTRRAWLRVVVRDEKGKVLLSSGEVDPIGRIVDMQGQALDSELAGGPVEPHRDVIRAGDQIAAFRGIMADAHGAPTHTLVRAASWLVDDRLLPAGWSSQHPQAARTAPVGTENDPDFTAGRDGVHYELEMHTSGPIDIEVSLLYQTLSSRWAAELFRWDTPEVRTFRRLYDGADKRPEILATHTHREP